MPVRFCALCALVAALAAGCSSAPPAKPEPIDVTLTVTLPGGQPGRDLTVNCFPTEASQMQGGGKTDAGGKVTAKLTPGKYTFAVEGTAAALKAVPAKYQQNDAAHSFQVPATGPAAVALKIDN